MEETGVHWVLNYGEEFDALGQNEGNMGGNVEGILELQWELGLAGKKALDRKRREETLGRLTEVTLATNHCICSLLTTC